MASDAKAIGKVFSKVLPRCKPSAAEMKRDFSAANSLIWKLERVVPPAVEIKLVGSLAKGTNLSGNREFDIFLLFPRHYSHQEMAMLGLHYARRAFSGMRTEARYAEHPYLQVFSGDRHADIVPAYKIGHVGERGSAVDRSPLHTAYVNSKLGERGKDEVRLLKRFMKNFGVYGAELRTEGFSGYLCELLVICYGSLLGLMEEAAKWDAPAIDMEGGRCAEALRKAFSSPLVFIDPIDPKRNVAAVVSQTSLSRFVFACRRFLKSPSERFFFSRKGTWSAGEIRRAIAARGTSSYLVSFPAQKAVPDVLWPQLKKTAHALSRRLEEDGFDVFGLYHWSDGKECAILFELPCGKLPFVKKVAGPAVRFGRDCEEFVKRHKKALNLHIEHERLVAVERRKETDALKALSAACKNPIGLGVPGEMAKELCKAKVSEASRALCKKYLEFYSDYFFAKIA